MVSEGRVLGKTRLVHFIGIGGIGMSGIAELLANLGYIVTGSDERRSSITERLASLGITIAYGHAAGHVGNADVVVVSSAVRPGNPEVVEAARRQIPVIPRAEMLAELMRLRYAIAVAGAHGKTTTTSMIALVLERAGLDPTAVIGGRLSAFGGNARLGRGELMVAEADESDRSFLKLFPTIAVITNIDREHLESYGGLGDLQQAFVDFANRVPFYGAVVACADDENLVAVLSRMTRRVITYGLGADADITAADVKLGPLTAGAVVKRRARSADDAAESPVALGPLLLNVPGRHNLLNALATVAVGLELGLPFERIAAGLHDFRGVERRFEVRGEPDGILLVDDYGHHPTEIAAVLEAARALNRRIVVAFQPHRFTRTAALMDDFGPALAGADHLVLTDIYAAGEDPIPGVTLEALAASVRRSTLAPVEVVPGLEDVAPAVARIARPGDVVITLGAGSIGTVPDRLLELLTRGAGREGGPCPGRASVRKEGA
jgi:UDP-N-acetylmuramate--alanine ligase